MGHLQVSCFVVWLLCLGVCATIGFTFCPVNEKHVLLLEQRREFNLLGSAPAASFEQLFCCCAHFWQRILPSCWTPPPSTCWVETCQNMSKCRLCRSTMVECCNFIWYNLRMTPSRRHHGSLFQMRKRGGVRKHSQDGRAGQGPRSFHLPSWPPLASQWRWHC